MVFYIIMGWAFALNMWIFKTYTQLRHAFLGRGRSPLPPGAPLPVPCLPALRGP